METCRVCGESKKLSEFEKVSHFIKYKKNGQKMRWCKDCQRMWMAMKREEEYKDRYLQPREEIIVSFD